MEMWLENVIRQLILYSLPVLISLSVITAIETRNTKESPFSLLAKEATWLPWLASILFSRGVIVSLPFSYTPGVRAALIRLGVHALLCFIGFLLYWWCLAHQPPVGLPPLHQWWAKVLMFYNLCMAALHLLPQPGFVVGELLDMNKRIDYRKGIWIFAALAATPLLDMSAGRFIIYPIYEQLVSMISNS